MSRLPLGGFLLAQAVSTTGTRVSMIAVPWFVLTTTGSAAQTGLVAFAELVPLVGAQALGGPHIDRLGPRRVSIGCDLGSVVAVGAVPLLHGLGALSFPLLLGLVALAGALRGPGEAAKLALIPGLCAQSAMSTERVTGLDGAVARTAAMTGAAVGAGLVAAVGAVNALVVDAASFGLSAVLVLALVRVREPEPSDPGEDAAPYAEALRDGWRFLRRDPVLLGLMVMVAVTNFLDQAFNAVLLPVWARTSGNGVGAVGLVGTTFAAAAIGGSVVAAATGHRLNRFWTYLGCFTLAGAPRFLALGLGAPLWGVVAVCLVAGFGAGFINPILTTVTFERIPAPLLGRVSSMSNAMSWALMPLGALAGGAVVGLAGVSPVLLGFGAAYLLATSAPALMPSWRELDARPQLDRVGAEETSEATNSSFSSTGAGMTKG